MDHKDVLIQDLRADKKKLTEELKEYRQLEEKMHEKFQGHINTETIVNSFIAFYDTQEVNEELAECLLLTNENAKKYKEYKQLEEQGLLLKLPCAIGTTVYEVTNHGIKGHWDEHRWIVDEWSGWIVRERTFNLFMIADGSLGKTIFLTEQEAQSALEKMKAGGVNE